MDWNPAANDGGVTRGRPRIPRGCSTKKGHFAPGVINPSQPRSKVTPATNQGQWCQQIEAHSSTAIREDCPQPAGDAGPVLVWCRGSVCDAGPASNQHRANISCAMNLYPCKKKTAGLNLGQRWPVLRQRWFDVCTVKIPPNYEMLQSPF